RRLKVVTLRVAAPPRGWRPLIRAALPHDLHQHRRRYRRVQIRNRTPGKDFTAYIEASLHREKQ
ncbi:MAG TPA: hypothetical protein VKJ01_24910, partial [Candidatus Solibacter sp.]|nr:hypothetical protein [Candidatus Solibacter sp.]